MITKKRKMRTINSENHLKTSGGPVTHLPILMNNTRVRTSKTKYLIATSSFNILNEEDGVLLTPQHASSVSHRPTDTCYSLGSL